MKWFEEASTLEELEKARAELSSTEGYAENKKAIRRAYQRRKAALKAELLAAEEAAAAAETAQEPVKETEAPAEEPAAAETAQEPVKETEAPAEEPAVAETAQEPVKETEAPTEEPAVAETAQEPAEETEAPTEEPAEAEEGEKAEEETKEKETADEEKTEDTADISVEKEEAPAKGKSAGMIAVLVAVVLLLAALVIAMVYMGKKQETASAASTAATEEAVVYTIPADGNPDDATCKGTYTASEAEVAKNRDTVIATCGSESLTVGQFQIFYWMDVQSFLGQYGAYISFIGLDLSHGLDEQSCAMEEGLTWQQYFVDSALSSWHNYSALAQKGAEAGVGIKPEYQALIDSMESDMETAAQTNGYASAQDMLTKNMGSAATMDDYRSFLTLYYRALSFYETWMEQNTPTDEQVEAYFAEHEATYADEGVTKESCTVDVRHILIIPVENENGEVTDEAKAAAEQKAKDVLNTFLSGEQTEEAFGKLAGEHSEDPGSNTNGGLYQGVYEGQMVPAFNDWCFDAERQIGDTGIVETDYGYHVMYFVNKTPTWKDTVSNDMLAQSADKMFTETMETYPLKVDFSKIQICAVNMAG